MTTDPAIHFCGLTHCEGPSHTWVDGAKAYTCPGPSADRAAVRCTSCEHEARYHDVDGRCWFTVEQGVPERDSVCACQLRRMADEAQQAGEGDAVVGYGEVDCRTPETHNWGCGCPTDPPHRGDWTEHWLRERREEYTRGTTEWQAVDWVLDRYRLHADTGTLLSGHVCECRDGADCDCREQPEREGR